ncbi:MAG: hypothetical protein ACYDDU_00435 [Dermatophilaceae bacterium]
MSTLEQDPRLQLDALLALLDAAVRVAMAYALPVDSVPGLSGALWIATLVLLQIITNLYFLRSGLWTSCSTDPEHEARVLVGLAPSQTVDMARSLVREGRPFAAHEVGVLEGWTGRRT